MTQTLSTKLLEALKANDLSIRELERQAGLKKSVVHNIIAGKSKTPTIKTLMAICNVLGCTVEELAGVNSKSASVEENLLPFDPILMIECVRTVGEIFETLHIQADVNKAIELIQEVFNYCGRKQDRIIDRDFAQWIIKKTFLKD